MKIIRAPLRVSCFGGGTDLDPFCAEHGSTIISFAIDRYMYLIWNPRPTGDCRLSYSKVEELESLRDAEHTLVREAAQRYGITEPCTLTIVCDVPKGTGLGSSSALAVCLVRLICQNVGGWNWKKVALKAGSIEQAVSHAGWQDLLPAVYGRFNVYHISPGGLEATPMEELMEHLDVVTPPLWDLINTHGLLLYTGRSRPADDILGTWQKSEEQLWDIKLLADQVAAAIDTIDLPTLAEYLNLTWQMKREIGGVTDPTLNRQYGVAMMNGALAGKLCGAGAGGCWFFLVPPEKRERVKEALGLREIPFQVAEKGVELWEL
jgi:D-glycero-alpha-D-manno-heptose-7-phosphate kinase